MAWSVTQHDVGAANTSSTAYTSGAFTPGADRLLIVISYIVTAVTITGITGHDGGGSWVQLFSQEGVANAAADVEIWGCFTGSSPSSGSVVISKSGYTESFSANIIEFHEDVVGVDMSGTVANAIGVNGFDVGGYDVSPHQVVLGAFSDSDNLTLGVGFAQGIAANFTFSGYTALAMNENGFSILALYLASEDQTVDATTDSEKIAGIFACEVKMASGSPATRRIMTISNLFNFWPLMFLAGPIKNVSLKRRDFFKPWKWLVLFLTGIN